ncbi:MAG: flagellar hook-associated protein FlgK [Terracidiphilus sp.]|jgi:flagellar hook-associated protein 1 FlgK
MGTINSAFSLISGALDADQSALSIVANNVANANTPGYTTETPNWQENSPVEINGVPYGDGVTETGATSRRDSVLEERLDQQQQLASASSVRMTALDNVQALFTPDSGSSSSRAGDIGSDITSFFNSFASLEANPTDNSLREEVLSSATTLAGDISNAAASLNSQSSGLGQEAAGVTSQVNSLTGAIAQLNQQIQSISPDADAGTLEDQRNEDVSQLSQLIGINQISTGNNGLALTTTSGQLLVSEGSSFQLTTGTVNGATDFFLGGTDITSQLASGGGELGGYLTARDQDIPSALNSLDQLAYGISTSVNQLNNAGTDLDGVTGTAASPLNIFNEPTQVAGSAASMSVVMTDPNQIAAAGLGQGTGDDSNAIAMANLANESLLQPVATTSFSMTQNLSSATPLNGTTSGSVQIYDSLGKSYNATVTYTKEGANTWGYSISVPDTLTADTRVANQVRYSFGPGETVDPGTNLTITGSAGGGTATIVAPVVVPGEAVGSAGPPATGYVAALDAQLTAAGIIGVTVTNTGGVLTISGATATAGSVIADPVASANATGTLTFNGSGALISPAANVSGITFGGLSDGASTMNLDWGLFAANGAANINQTAAASAQSAQSQNGSAGVNNGETPTDFYSNFVSTLGATVSGVQAENTAQNASVTQLQTQNNALSSVNLNDEAAAMSTLQSSYQAASQVFAMLNTIMASALNLGEQTTVS